VRKARWLVPLLVAAPLLADERSGEEGEVAVRAECTWPDDLPGGYLPIRVELANRGEAEADVLVRARHAYVLDQVEKRLVLAPGEAREFDLYCRLEPGLDAQYAVELEVDGEQLGLGFLGSDRSDLGGRSAVVLLGEERLGREALGRWEELLRPLGLGVSTAGFADLPDRQLGYSSLSAVLLDTSAGLPPAARFGPLLSWARLGGTLVLYGPRAVEEARGEPALAAWLEPRFELTPDPASPVRTFACAQGRLVVLEVAEPDAAGLQAVAAMLDGTDSWLPDVADSRGRRLAPRDTPAPGLPLRALAAILVLFALLIGPVNSILVKRTGRPVLLLISVPGIALVCGFLLVGYGVLAQGLDVKVVRHTYALLDQRLRRASAADAMVLFAGMSPGPGLRPGPGTSVYVERSRASRRRWRFQQSFRMDLSDGMLLAEDYLPVRQTSPVWALTDDTARGRVQVAQRDGGLELTNALGAGIEALVLRAADGGWYRLEAPLAEGGRAPLAPCSYITGSNESAPAVSAVFAAGPSELPPGCYAATLTGTPFADDCGIELNELAGRHLLVGVLEEEAGK
jgi:hypothetical protein